jgi:hypothetical protein
MDQIESIHGRASAHTRHSIVLVVALNRLGQCEKKSINLTEGIGLMDWIVGLWQSWNPGTFRGGLRSTRNEDRGYQKTVLPSTTIETIIYCLIKKNFSRTPHHVLGCETIAKQIHRVAKQIHRI